MQAIIELTGLYPRSQELVSATRDYDRKRIDQEELNRVLHAQQDRLLTLQRELGVKRLSDGMLNWQDHFRPFADFCDGLKPDTLTRFTDTNTFYRQPTITDDISFTGKNIDGFFLGLGDQGQWKATLPAPLYVARLADDQHYGSIEKLANAYTDILIQLIGKLSNSYQTIQLIDLTLGYDGVDSDALRIVRETTERLIKNLDCAVSYHIPYTCSRETAETLLVSSVDAIGIDFFHTDVDELPSFDGKTGLIAGCVDSRTSLVEDPKAIADLLKRAADHLKPRDMVMTSNIDLHYVPDAIAEKKLRSMKESLSLAHMEQS